MNADSSNSASNGNNALVSHHLNVPPDDEVSISSVNSDSGYPDDENQLYHLNMPELAQLDAVDVYVHSAGDAEVSLEPFGDDEAGSAQDVQSSVSGSRGPLSVADNSLSHADSSVHVVEEADRAIDGPDSDPIQIHSSLSSQSIGAAAAPDDNIVDDQADRVAENPYSDAYFAEWRIGRKSSLGLRIRLSAHENSKKVYALLSHGHAHFLKIFRPDGYLALCQRISDINPTDMGKGFSISASDDFIVVHLEGYLSVYTLGLVSKAWVALVDSCDVLAKGDDVYVLTSRQGELIMDVFHVQENTSNSRRGTDISFQKEIKLNLPAMDEATLSKKRNEEAILVGGIRGGKYIVHKLAFPAMNRRLRIETKLSGDSIKYNICLSATGSDIIIVSCKPFIDIWRRDRLQRRIDEQANVQDITVLDDRLIVAMDVNIQFTNLHKLVDPNDFCEVHWERFTYFSEHEKRTIAVSSSPENDDIHVFMQGGHIIGYEYPSCRLLEIICTGITGDRIRMRMTDIGYTVVGFDDKVLLVDSGGNIVCTRNVATTLLDVGFCRGHVFVLTTNDVIRFLLHVQACPTDSNISPNIFEVPTTSNVELKPREILHLPASIKRGFMFLTEMYFVALTDRGVVRRDLERPPRSNRATSLLDHTVAALSVGGPGAALSVGEPGAALSVGEPGAALSVGEPGAALSVGGPGAALSVGGPGAALSVGEPGAAQQGRYVAASLGRHVAAQFMDGPRAAPFVIDGGGRLLVAGETGVDVYDVTWRRLLGTIRHVSEDISGRMITDMTLCHNRVIICYGQECYIATPLTGGLDPDPDPLQSEDLDPRHP